MNRTILLSCLLLFAPPSLRAADTTSRPASRPNIVFIYADDWGWGDLSCHGHRVLKTPNLDRLAREGVDFQQFNVLNPVCSPSRVAAMTGRYPARFGVNTVFGDTQPPPEMPDWLDGRAPTTPRFLKAAGYRTAHFGKWHMGDKPDGPTMSDYGIDDSAVYHGPGPKSGFHDIADRAAKFIADNSARPFFLDVWLHESHTMHAPTPASLAKWQHLDDERMRVYAAVITDGDNYVGTILDALEKAGVAQNTIVVFSSDNGPENTGGEKDRGSLGKLGSYYSVGDTGGLRGRKRSLFEGGIRVPFIVRWPGHATPGMKNQRTVFTAVDLLPTFCAAAGVTPPADAAGDGENLLAAFNGEEVLRRRPVFWLHAGSKTEPDCWPRLAVRDGDWKLVMTYDAARVELHDLSTDRAEAVQNNVAKAHPDVVARLSQLAMTWHAGLPVKADPSCLSKAQPRAAVPPAAAGKSETKPRVTPAQRVEAFKRWDADADGRLTLDEYKAGLKGQDDLEGRFKRFDKDGDGKLTVEEFAGPQIK
jgi:N-acetylgalactosamine-6-sulfatase